MRYTVPRDVVWTTETDEGGNARTFVAPLPRGPISVLEGTAAIIWHVVARAGAATPAEGVAQRVGVPVHDIRDEVDCFLAQLEQRGLLIRD